MKKINGKLMTFCNWNGIFESSMRNQYFTSNIKEMHIKTEEWLADKLRVIISDPRGDFKEYEKHPDSVN